MSAKTLAAFFSGVALTAAVVVIVGLFTPIARAQEGDVTPEIPPAAGEASLADLTAAFEQVRSEIRDADIRGFYDKLIAVYNLDEEASQAGPESPAPLPDIAKIQHAALTLPLQEAGKEIKDQEIRDFYYRFLKEAGLSAPAPEP